MTLDFYFDLVCPFAYLAFTRVSSLARQAGLSVRYRPILLGGLLKQLGTGDPNATMPEAKARLIRLDARRQAAWMGVPLRFPDAHPRRTLSAMRLLCAADPQGVPELAAALYEAAWVHDQDIADREVLASFAQRSGMQVDCIDRPEIKERLREATDEAARASVFGVPTFVLGQTRVFGVDRLSLLREALSLPEEPAPPLPSPRRGAVIEWFHDLASPFSYLSSARIEALCQQVGATLLPRPILVGALFREIGTPMVPIHTFSPAKAAWARQDMERQAQRAGLPFTFPSRFPLRSLLGQRVLCAEPSAHQALYKAAWADDLDISEPGVLASVLERAGYDAPALLDQAEQPANKEALRQNTERAKAVGVCGVPSFLVDGTELFWGYDRLHQVAHAARGWRLDDPAPPRDSAGQEEPSP